MDVPDVTGLGDVDRILDAEQVHRQWNSEPESVAEHRSLDESVESVERFDRALRVELSFDATEARDVRLAELGVCERQERGDCHDRGRAG